MRAYPFLIVWLGLISSVSAEFLVSSFSGNQVFRYDGSNGALIGEFGAGNLAQPFGLRFTPAGDLLVVSGNQNSVQQFLGATGQFAGTFNGGGGLSLPVGIVAGPGGDYYVASFANHKVVVTGGSNVVTLPVAAGGRYFRLANTNASLIP